MKVRGGEVREGKGKRGEDRRGVYKKVLHSSLCSKIMRFESGTIVHFAYLGTN